MYRLPISHIKKIVENILDTCFGHVWNIAEMWNMPFKIKVFDTVNALSYSKLN